MVVADITLTCCLETLVRLALRILQVAQSSRSLFLLNSRKWYYLEDTISVGEVLLLFHLTIDQMKMCCYFSDRASCPVPLCLLLYTMLSDFALNTCISSPKAPTHIFYEQQPVGQMAARPWGL